VSLALEEGSEALNLLGGAEDKGEESPPHNKSKRGDMRSELAQQTTLRSQILSSYRMRRHTKRKRGEVIFEEERKKKKKNSREDF